MQRSLENTLRTVRLQWSLNVVLRLAAVVLAAAGGVAAAALAAERLFGVTLVEPWTAAALAGAAVLLIAGLAALRVPRPMQVAVEIDRRLAFRERFSTALSLAGSEDAFARAATREAHDAARNLSAGGRFPVRLSRHWLATVAAWAIAGGVFFFLPEMDVLGYAAGRKDRQSQAARLQQARADVKAAATKVKTAVERVNDAQIAAELDKIGELTKGLKPADVRREAIRKLGELADRLKEMGKSEQVQAADRMKQMLKQLHGTPGALNDELNRALAGGNFASAAKMLRDLMQKLNDEKLSDEDKKKLADQLKDLARQLARIGNERKQREDALEREGLDAETAEKLAGMTDKELREALKKEGLSDEQIDELMEKLNSARQACDNCQGLAKGLAKSVGKMGELLPDGLVGVIEGLDGMSDQDAEAASLEEALREIERAVALLGEGDCEGDGEMDTDAPGLWQDGESDREGKGPGGGRARAWGERPVGEPEKTGVRKTGVKNQPSKDSEIIASWLFKGPQAKGVSKRKLTEVVRAQKSAAAEAVRDNRIPRKYESAVKRYFGDLEKSAAGKADKP